MLIPSIHFPGICDEAITFYKETLGAEAKDVAYFRDAPAEFSEDNDLPPNFVMHSEILLFGTSVIMTDGAEKRITGDNFSLTVALESAEEVTSVFSALAKDGKITDALAPQFWSSLCGSVEDRFGVSWHIYMNG